MYVHTYEAFERSRRRQGVFSVSLIAWTRVSSVLVGPVFAVIIRVSYPRACVTRVLFFVVFNSPLLFSLPSLQTLDNF